MESLLCNEVWLMSPNNLQENDGFCLFYTKQDCEEVFGIFLSKEAKYMPEKGYLKLVKNDDLIYNARFKAVNWIIKCQRKMDLSLETVFMAVNYLDRFISLSQCQGWKCWMFELLSIACLSIASKFNDTISHPLHEFQVEISFAPRIIQRMELTILKTLSWRMDSTTSFSYIDLLIQTIDSLNRNLVEDLTKRVAELLLNALLDPKFLEFQQSVIAMSAVRCVFEVLFPSTNNDSLVHLETIIIPQDHKDDLMIKCKRMMGKLLVEEHNLLTWHGPSSPVTVFNFYDFPVDFSLIKKPAEINIHLRSNKKRKREEPENGGL